jgi:hypothetical protein
VVINGLLYDPLGRSELCLDRGAFQQIAAAGTAEEALDKGAGKDLMRSGLVDNGIRWHLDANLS